MSTTARRSRPKADATLGRASIRRQLSMTLLLAMGALWLLLTTVGLISVRHEAQTIIDAQLSLSGHGLMTLLAHEIHEGYPDPALAVEQIVPDIFPGSENSYVVPPVFVVRGGNGQLMLHSKGAQPLLSAFTSDLPLGLGDVSINGTQWRVLALQDAPSQWWVAVAQPSQKQQELAQELAMYVISPLLLLVLPLLAIIIHYAVRHGLDSLQRLTASVTRRSVDDSSTLTSPEVPEEALPLTLALDDLLSRLHQAHAREQRFIADATHELRTPLAGLKTQAQVALRAVDEPQRRAALQSLVTGVDAATRLITQLLTLARLDHHNTERMTVVTDLLEVTRDVCLELAPAVLESGADLGLDGRQPCPVRGDRTLLTVLVRNLIENAIHYGGNRHIAVSVRCATNGVLLTVKDRGPGIPEADLQRVFERFYRSSNQHAPGSGLGLAIVNGICDSLDAHIELSNRATLGLAIRVAFPAIDPSVAHH